MQNIQQLLEESSRHHSHLCPRQILGVRLGLMGLKALQLSPNGESKRLLVISETDGCFIDGVIAATECRVGNRTLRVEDYGKTAATFVDTLTGRAIRVAPCEGIRENALHYVPAESGRYLAQMVAYQTMPDEMMFTLQKVVLNVPLQELISRPGMRVCCELCGEEIINEREIYKNNKILCKTCGAGGYYHDAQRVSMDMENLEENVV